MVDSCVIDGRGFAEGLKISFGHNIIVRDCIIHGGYEDCVDIVRGANISFIRCQFISYNSKQHITIKGGARDVTIHSCEFVNKFQKWYNGALVDIGNWSDYDIIHRPKTRNILIKKCKLTNVGFKLLSRTIFGNNLTVIKTSGLNLKIPSIITRLFFRLRKSGKLGSVADVSSVDRRIYNIEK